jgi:hypothetical protein
VHVIVPGLVPNQSQSVCQSDTQAGCDQTISCPHPRTSRIHRAATLSTENPHHLNGIPACVHAAH